MQSSYRANLVALADAAVRKAINRPTLPDPTPSAGIVIPQDAVQIRDADKFGDAFSFAVNFLAANVPVMVLQRPIGLRAQLLIVNFNVVGNIAYAFDRVPTLLGDSVVIGAGGNRNWDNACPQGDLYIVSSGAGTVTVEYINVKDAPAPKWA